ncbi:hypothetical protein [Candidatus Electrothrix sp.]|uniref:hypothetical protein n=1 Tax=Candidatus Electrothrix sp. TaxID=2170559 RepID=UPI0040577EB3
MNRGDLRGFCGRQNRVGAVDGVAFVADETDCGAEASEVAAMMAAAVVDRLGEL